MPVTREEIQGHLEHFNIPYHVVEDQIYVVANCQRHVDGDGDKQVTIAIAIDYDGAQLRLSVPWAYVCTDMHHFGVLAEACLLVCSRLAPVVFNLDRNDGELSFARVLPVVDGQVTAEQFLHLLHSMVKAADRMEPIIRPAIDEGKLVSVQEVLRLERAEARSDDETEADEPDAGTARIERLLN